MRPCILLLRGSRTAVAPGPTTGRTAPLVATEGGAAGPHRSHVDRKAAPPSPVSSSDTDFPSSPLPLRRRHGSSETSEAVADLCRIACGAAAGRDRPWGGPPATNDGNIGSLCNRAGTGAAVGCGCDDRDGGSGGGSGVQAPADPLLQRNTLAEPAPGERASPTDAGGWELRWLCNPPPPRLLLLLPRPRPSSSPTPVRLRVSCCCCSGSTPAPSDRACESPERPRPIVATARSAVAGAHAATGASYQKPSLPEGAARAVAAIEVTTGAE